MSKLGVVVLALTLIVAASTSIAVAASASTSPTSGTFAYLWPVNAQTAWLVVDTVEGGERVLRTTDGGASWDDVTPHQVSDLVNTTNVGNGTATPKVVFLGAERAWTNAAGTLVATTDGGTVWQDIAHIPVGCVPLQFVDPTHGWCATSGVAAGSEGIGLYRTVDGGLRWKEISVTGPTTAAPGSLPFICEKAISFTSRTVGWAGLNCEYLDHVYETTDAGVRWVVRTIAAMPASVAHAQISVAPPVLTDEFGAGVITAGEDAIFYRSEDRGRSWEAVVPPGGLRAWYADVINALQWRLADDQRILATDDGGRAWKTITPHWPVHSVTPEKALAGIQFVTPKIGWAQDFDRFTDTTSLLRTTDGGTSWTELRY